MWVIKAAALLVVEDGQILLIREETDRQEIGKFAGMLSMPMGHIETGENPCTAAVRECREEADLEVVIDYPLGFFQIEMPRRRRAGVWAYKGHAVGSKTTPSGIWMSIEEFLALNPFSLRPLNHEIFQTFRLAQALQQNGTNSTEEIIKEAMPESARVVFTPTPS